MGIDETQNKRRYLNGQVISQSQFVAFTNKLKSAVALYPSLSTTEENWQSEKNLSKLGQCGRFVIDDTAGTIRLPAVVNAQSLTDLQYLGTIKSESLPKPTLILRTDSSSSTDTDLDAIYGNDGYTAATPLNTGDTDEYMHRTYTTSNSAYMDIFHSSYQDNAPVQQEAVQYPYYIQVATGVEETLPAIREYKVNNSDFFGKSMYSDVAPDNASWLASNGQWNAKSVYPDYYDWLVKQVNAGVNGFKGMIGYAWKKPNEDVRWWTAVRNPKVGDTVYGGVGIGRAGNVTAINQDGTITFYDDNVSLYQENLVYTESENINVDGTLKFANDYDWVVNTSDKTFRLPLKTRLASGSAVAGNGMTLGLTDGTNNFGLQINGNSGNNSLSSISQYGQPVGTAWTENVVNPVKSVGVTTDPTKSGIETSSAGLRLYFYVGDTVQDASLINAGAVLGQLANGINRTAKSDRETVVGWGFPDWDTEVQLSGTEYTATYKCWLISLTIIGGTAEALLYINGKLVTKEYGDYAQLQIPLDVGDVVTSNTPFTGISIYAMKGLIND